MMENNTNKVAFGFWLYILSDCVLFAGLFAAYAVLQNATFGGPSIFDISNVPYVFVETLLLLTSSFTMGLALALAKSSFEKGKTWPSGLERAFRKSFSHRAIVTSLLLVTLLLGVAFLGMELHEFMHLVAQGSGPSTSAFFSAYFTLVGTHGLHVLAGSIWMLVVVAHILWRGLSPSTLRKLLCLSLFWHFLDIIWIFIFTFVYLLGAL